MITVEPSRQPAQFKSLDSRRRLGLIALSTDLTSEYDIARIIPPAAARVYVTRVAFENPTTPENLRKMTPALTVAADLILPGIKLGAICYSCTAASVVIGDSEVSSAIGKARPAVPVVTPTRAARLALHTLSVRRIAILTPYLAETSQPMARYFTNNGFEITRFTCFGLEDDRQMALVDTNSIVEAALQLDDGRAEGFFISCTALPAIDCISEIEARTGKPVVTSNQASAWAMMRLAGIEDKISGFGRLLGMSLANELHEQVTRVTE